MSKNNGHTYVHLKTQTKVEKDNIAKFQMNNASTKYFSNITNYMQFIYLHVLEL